MGWEMPGRDDSTHDGKLEARGQDSGTQASSQKSHGRRTIRATARPRELMADGSDIADCWTAKIITLFPQVFPGTLAASLTGRALDSGLWRYQTIDLREFGVGRHLNVDDRPAGGGAGMVLRPDVVGAAVEHARRGVSDPSEDWPTVALSPRGTPFTQQTATRFSQARGITLICGRFEGLDQRVLDHYGIEEVSVGDFILTGGEIAAQALIDATVRLIPRMLGNQASVEDESFAHGLLEYPQYTRPVIWAGHRIPEVLLSGHHGQVERWRKTTAERLTKQRRPDLWRAYCDTNGRDPEEDPEL